MNTLASAPLGTVWRSPGAWYWLWAAIFGGLVFIFYDGLAFMIKYWYEREEYSHGFLIPPVVAFMIWQKRDQLERLPLQGSWLGVALVALGLCAYLAGELSTIYTIVQYAFVSVLIGLVLAGIGARAFTRIWAPLALLLLMVPLPNFFYYNLSASLQLLSSKIGVQFIRLFDIGVLLTGNVIDLGTYRLQVVEACSGLRYLFPLLTLGIIVASFYKAPLWKRIALVFSTIPITVLMNSLRIGIIGVTVEYWGQAMAEGLLHDFEGWAMFMACFGILLLEMWCLNAVAADGRSFRDVFAIEYPAPTPRDAPTAMRKVPLQFAVAAAFVGLTALAALAMPQRVEQTPAREAFAAFPLNLGDWRGRQQTMEREYIDELKFTDYLMADYVNADATVNLYIAYYASQRKGQSVHSPRTCLPGGGWQMTNLSQEEVRLDSGTSVPVNRVEIQFGNEKQLVYYWFKQRDRQITNEYLVKWYMFWDALSRNRSDGSLIRLITPLKSHESTAVADQRLQDMVKRTVPLLPKYVPD